MRQPGCLETGDSVFLLAGIENNPLSRNVTVLKEEEKMHSLMKKLNLVSPVKLTGAVTLLVCLFFLAGAAGATASTTTSTPPQPTLTPLRPMGRFFMTLFSTGADGFNLTSVSCRSQQQAPRPVRFPFCLYGDASTSPGSLLITLGTMSDNVLTSTPSVETFNLTTPYSLAAGTRYWVGLASNDSSAAWQYSYASGVGLAGEYWSSTFDGVMANYVKCFCVWPSSRCR